MFDDGLVEPESPYSRHVPTRREKALRDIGGYRVVNNGYSQAVPVPGDAEFFMVVSEGGASHLEIGGADATSSSPFYCPQNVPIKDYPIIPGQPIACYGASSTVITNFRFLGRIYQDE